MSESIHSAIQAINGEIVVGNYDTILLLGAYPQTKLREYSRRISQLLLKSSSTLEISITDVIIKIERFQSLIEAKQRPFRFFKDRISRNNLIREYRSIIAYLDEITLYFQIQQAHLLKENKVLESLSYAVQDTEAELQECIDKGNRVLQSKRTTTKINIGTPFVAVNGDDVDDWYFRLEKRIDALQISHTLSLQNQAQLRLLYSNNLALIDNATTILSNTIPLWQTQTAILLGTALVKKRVCEYDRIVKTVENFGKQLGLHHQNSGELTPTEVTTLREQTQSLTRALQEIADLESSDDTIRKNLLKLLTEG